MAGIIVIIKPGDRLLDTHEIMVWQKSGQPDLDAWRKAIGDGWIELIKVRWGGKIRDAFVDEEGLLKKLPPNDLATTLCVNGHFIVGRMAIWVPEPKKRLKAPSRVSQIVDVK